MLFCRLAYVGQIVSRNIMLNLSVYELFEECSFSFQFLTWVWSKRIRLQKRLSTFDKLKQMEYINSSAEKASSLHK